MSTMYPFLIERDDEPDFEFVGEVVACGIAYDDQTDCVARGTMIRLFKTECDLWVAEMLDFTEYRGVRTTTRSAGAASAKPEDLVEFIGNGRAAKALYTSAGSVLPRPIAAVG